jgi:hypothetical protein
MLSSNALRKPAATAANRFSPEVYDGMYGQFGAYNEASPAYALRRRQSTMWTIWSSWAAAPACFRSR